MSSTLAEIHVHPTEINSLYELGEVDLRPSDTGITPAINEHVIVRNVYDNQQTAIARYVGGNIFLLVDTSDLSFQNLRARDASQVAFMSSLADPDTLLSVATGSAGTGKTTLAVACALDRYLQEKKRILLCKPTVMVSESQAFGAVPGDIGEKYAPYLGSYHIILKKLLGKGGSYLDTMITKGDLEFIPLELVRGCTFEDCTFILDEAANTDWHELNTLISRMGQGSKMILTGDLNQIDRNFAREDSGLWQLVHSDPFRRSPITSHTPLKVQYRSPICKLAADVSKWITDERQRNSFTAEGDPELYTFR